MIAAVQMIQLIREDDVLLMGLRTGGIIAAVVTMIFVYVEEGANLVRILREVKEREEYILEQRMLGNYDLILPMLRPQFQSKYSYLYDSDISDKEGHWMNEVYCIRYGLNHVEAVPREDWRE